MQQQSYRLKGKYVAELEPGTSFSDCIFVVTNQEVREASNGRFVAMMLSDNSGTCQAKRFQATLAEQEMLLACRFILASGIVDASSRYMGQVTVTKMQKVEPDPIDLTPYVPSLKDDHKEHLAQFIRLVSSIRDPNLQRILQEVFDEATLRAFKNAVAAQVKHHAYPGGLLEHSVEVAALCDAACVVLPSLNRDFLVACALIHDIGKLDEMEHGLATGEYTASGMLVGHIVSGALRLNQAANKIDGFPESLKNAITHMILSHHGVPEFGAAKTPAIPEAFVLSQCDMMSARVNECATASAAARPGQTSVRRGFGDHLFLGDLGLRKTVST